MYCYSELSGAVVVGEQSSMDRTGGRSGQTDSAPPPEPASALAEVVAVLAVVVGGGHRATVLSVLPDTRVPSDWKPRPLMQPDGPVSVRTHFPSNHSLIDLSTEPDTSTPDGDTRRETTLSV